MRPRVLACAVAVLCGVALGILPPLLATGGGTAGHAVHVVLSGGWTWAAFAFAVGAARGSRAESVVLATVSLFAGVVAYYLTKSVHNELRAVDLGGADPRLLQESVNSTGVLMWGLAAALLGPLLGLAGSLARENGPRGLPFRLLVPAMAFAETSMRLRVEASSQEPVVALTWSAVRWAAVAAAVVLAGLAATAGRRSRRRLSG
ncbi:DUF6518 family protein [Streptomyces sp. NBC_00158]|uniref:DUF6518 family protein n=1 Tax=Streptomyces sp. NBC_00158 TaxID=2903627 RepID=UPI003250DC20